MSNVVYKKINVNQILENIQESFYESVDEFIKEELPIEHVPMKTGNLRSSRNVKYYPNKVVIYFDDNKAKGAIYTHWMDNLTTNWTTPGTMSNFLDYPILYRGKKIWKKLNSKMKARGYK